MNEEELDDLTNDMWDELSPRQRVIDAVVSAIFIFVAVRLIF